MMRKRVRKENTKLKEKKKVQTGTLLIFLSQDNVKKGKANLYTFLQHERLITHPTLIPKL